MSLGALSCTSVTLCNVHILLAILSVSNIDERREEKLYGCWVTAVIITCRFNSLMVHLLFITEEVSLCQSDTVAALGLRTLRLCEYCSFVLGISPLHKHHIGANVNQPISSCVTPHRSRS